MTKSIVDIALDNFFMLGRMVSASKSDYDRRYPKHVVVFNANVCTKTHGKIWYGDLDITKDKAKLKELAKALGEDIYVLREMDGRFENEGAPKFELARAVISHDKVNISGE